MKTSLKKQTKYWGVVEYPIVLFLTGEEKIYLNMSRIMFFATHIVDNATKKYNSFFIV